MSNIFFLFFTFLIFISFPIAFGQSYNMDAYLLGEGETSFANDEVILDENQTLDLTSDVITVPETTQTIGGVDVDLTQEVQFFADDGGDVTISNTSLLTVIVSIPDQTKISAPTAWNGEITPPKEISTSGTVAAGFQTPTTSIQVGSPDVILVFDKSVTILLSGTTGQTAYKSPGSNTWISISGCTGNYANPDDPPANGECSISNGSDTKIVTFHFTEFTGLTVTPSPTPATTPAPSTSSGSSGGHGRTGVGPSSSGSFKSYDNNQPVNNIPKMPEWFSDVMLWQQQGLITTDEMLKAYKWMIDNIT